MNLDMVDLGRTSLIGALLLIGGGWTACGASAQLREASGVAVRGDRLLFVGDEASGRVYEVQVPDRLPLPGLGPFRGSIPVDVTTFSDVGGPMAMDLESIEVLNDGRTVVLSERLGALVGERGVIAEYPGLMAEIGGRGLEGLAVNEDGTIAALWEGGYFEQGELPTAVAGVGDLPPGPLNPLVCVHQVPGGGGEVCPDARDVFALRVPDAPDTLQAFRAPDLVWRHDQDGFIVLLSSTNAANNKFSFKWLQRFDMSGDPVGEPINLCDSRLLPDELRRSNVEGLAWFDAENLVLVNDSRSPATAVFIDVVPWPVTTRDVACDEPLQ